MSDNFGLGGLGLDKIVFDPKEVQPVFKKESFEEREERRIQHQQLENIKKYYEEHPDAILPSGEFGSKSLRDENGSIVMERTFRRR